MIKDREQKEAVYRHFRARGWVAQLEVPIVNESGVSKKAPPVTDIDVLGIQPTPELRWRSVVGDCKTRKHESPVNRVLWASGVMSAIGASSGIVLLKREAANRIERDHKLYADTRHILLLEEDEFPDYDRAIIFPTGSSAYPESLDSLEALRERAAAYSPRLHDYMRWVTSGAWMHFQNAALLRSSLGRAREIRGEIDPRRDEHLAMVVESAATFAVPFASLVGTVFRRHLKPNDRSDLDEATKVIIWGGRDHYEYMTKARAELLQARGLEKNASSPLELPEWDRFLEILRSALESPGYAFLVPQALRTASLGLISGRPDALRTVSDRNVLHLGMRLAMYFARAAGFPADCDERLKGVFAPRMTELAGEAARRTFT